MSGKSQGWKVCTPCSIYELSLKLKSRCGSLAATNETVRCYLQCCFAGCDRTDVRTNLIISRRVSFLKNFAITTSGFWPCLFIFKETIRSNCGIALAKLAGGAVGALVKCTDYRLGHLIWQRNRIYLRSVKRKRDVHTLRCNVSIQEFLPPVSKSGVRSPRPDCKHSGSLWKRPSLHRPAA